MKEHRDTFCTYNPIINFIFFIGAILFGMFFLHPAFLIGAVILSGLYHITIRGREGLKLVAGMVPVFMVLSLLNPVLNTKGTHVLLTWLGGRPYTWEALCYGMAIAAMFVSVLLWFASYNRVMTSDKFLYLFGRMIPSISLILTMVLRLIPDFQRKAGQISGARSCIGKAADSGKLRQKVENGMFILSALTSWALEGGIVMADSMKCRGYGSGRRSHFSRYRFDLRDKILLIVMLILMGITAFCGLQGAAQVSYTPIMKWNEMDDLISRVGLGAYCMFLLIPSALNRKTNY